MQGISVNGVLIGNDQIRAETSRLRISVEGSGRELSLEERVALRREATGQLVERALIAMEALRLGFAATDSEATQAVAALSNSANASDPEIAIDIRQRIAIDKLLAHWLKNVKRPTGGEIKEFYRANRERFWRSETVHAAHILKPSYEQAEAIRGRIIAGEDFAAVATATSECPEDAGDLGYFPLGKMVPEFDAVVFETPPGSLTPVFETPFGFHVVQVIDRKPEGIPALPEIAKEIEATLLRLKQDRVVEERLGLLHRNAVIQEIS